MNARSGIALLPVLYQRSVVNARSWIALLPVLCLRSVVNARSGIALLPVLYQRSVVNARSGIALLPVLYQRSVVNARSWIALLPVLYQRSVVKASRVTASRAQYLEKRLGPRTYNSPDSPSQPNTHTHNTRDEVEHHQYLQTVMYAQVDTTSNLYSCCGK